MHPWKIEQFQEKRSEIYEFMKKLSLHIDQEFRHILIHAPVKCGKRVMVETLTRILPDYKHYYVCSLNRTDVKIQKEELAEYGVSLHLTSNKDETQAAINAVNYDLNYNNQIIIHCDECDYGSGRNQNLNPLFTNFMEHLDVIFIYYSATPEETMYSQLSQRDDYLMLQFEPPSSYRGAQYFVDNGLVFGPFPCLQKEEGIITPTEHMKQVVRDSITSERNIGVIRIVGRVFSTELIKANSKHIETELNRLGFSRPFTIKVIGEKDKFEWENREICGGYTKAPLERNYIFFINQTCTRGTDLNGWHFRLAFWHDVRQSKTASSTLLQAILRPSYYVTNYMKDGIPQEQPIRMYVSENAMQLAASNDIQEYLSKGGKPPCRTKPAYVHTDAIYEIHKGSLEEVNLNLPEDEKINPETYEKEGEFLKTGRKLGIGSNSIPNRPANVEEVESRLKAQYSRTRFVKIPCYYDLRNPETLYWIAVKKLSAQSNHRARQPLYTTNTSMYKPPN